MEEKVIYLVVEVGTESEFVECAFTKKESANEYIKSKIDELKASNEEYEVIKKRIEDAEDELYEKYFCPNGSPKPNTDSEMYVKEEDDFYNFGIYNMVNEIFGYDKYTLNLMESRYYSDTLNYVIREIQLFN